MADPLVSSHSRTGEAVPSSTEDEATPSWLNRLLTVPTVAMAFALALGQCLLMPLQFIALALFVANGILLAVIVLPLHEGTAPRLSAKAMLSLVSVGLFWAWSALITWPRMHRWLISDPYFTYSLALLTAGLVLGAFFLRRALTRADTGGSAGLRNPTTALLFAALLLLPLVHPLSYAPLYLLVFLSCYHLLGELHRLRLFYWACAITAGAFAAGALIEHAFIVGRQWQGVSSLYRLGGSAWVPHTVLVACYLTVAFMITVYLARLCKESRVVWLLWLAAALQLAAIVLTQTRSAWAAGILCLLVLLRHRLRLLSGVLVGVMIAFGGLWMHRTGVQIWDWSPWKGELLWRWGNGWEEFLKHPVLGNGVGSLIFFSLRGYVDPHNILVLLLREVGVLGVLLLVAVAVFLLTRLCRSWKQRTAESRDLATPAVLGLLVIAVFSFTNYTGYNPSLAIVTFALLAALLGPVQALAPDRQVTGSLPHRLHRRALLLLPVVFVGMLLHTAIALAADRAKMAKPTLIPTLRVPPAIDSRFREREWQGATKIRDFTHDLTGQRVGPETTVYLGHDAMRLYVAILCREDDPRIRTRLKDRTPHAWDDWVGVYLTPPNSHNHEVYTFKISSDNGQCHDRVRPKYSYIGQLWDTPVVPPVPPRHGTWRASSSTSSSGWVAEFVIPLRDIGLQYAARGQRLKLRVSRNRAEVGREAADTTVAWPSCHGLYALPTEYEEVELQ